MKNQLEVSIVIPAYDEEYRILSTLKNYQGFFSEKFKNKFEIIVVSNNCSDRTFELVSNFLKKNKGIVNLNIPTYSGKGGAVMKGFKISKGKWVGFVDADGSVDAENFYKLYEKINGFSGIIASRRGKGAVVLDRSLMERFSSLVFNKIVVFLFNLKFKDTQCGAKLFDRKTALFLVDNCSEKGWIFDVDLLNICKKNDIKIIELPIRWVGKSGSKLDFYGKISSLLKLFIYKYNQSKKC